MTSAALALGGSAGPLAGLLAKASAILVLAWLVAAALRRGPADRRHLVWGLAALGLLALPVLRYIVPAWDVALLPAAGAGERPGLPAPEAHRAQPTGLDPAQLAVGIYAGGVSVCLAWLGLGLLRARRWSTTGRPVDDPAWRADLHRLRAELGISRPVLLRAGERVAAPVSWGLRRPIILLPADAETWTAACRRSVLLHELAHVARLDWPLQLAARLAVALYWFHPLAWLAGRRLALEAEHACDDRVLRQGGRASDYAQTLLTLAQRGRRRALPAAVTALSRRAQLSLRVLAILEPGTRRGGMRRSSIAAASSVAAAALAVLAALHVSAAPPRPAETGTALLEAAQRGELEEVRRLIAGGADVDTALRGDGTALIVTAREGHADVARLLLDHGADVDRAVRGDGNPLIMAARGGHRDIVEMLLDAGADVDAAVPGDDNPLVAAVAGGHGDVAALLLDRGADPALAAALR